MYKCKYCGSEFDEPKTNYLDEGDFPCCPECRSEDIEEMFKCKICDEWHTEDKKTETWLDVCQDCSRDLLLNLSAYIQQNYTEAQSEFLHDYLEIRYARTDV